MTFDHELIEKVTIAVIAAFEGCHPVGYQAQPVSHQEADDDARSNDYSLDCEVLDVSHRCSLLWFHVGDAFTVFAR